MIRLFINSVVLIVVLGYTGVIKGESGTNTFEQSEIQEAYSVTTAAVERVTVTSVQVQVPAEGTNTDYVITEPSSSIPHEAKPLTIVVMGRSGSGTSSTVRKLIGRKDLARSPTNSLVQEYSVRIPSAGSSLKFVDVSGLVDGRTPQTDALILGSLRAYLEEPGSSPPDFFIMVSGFDDNRYSGNQSAFIQTANRVQLLQKALYGGPNLPNTIFLMSKYMTETRDVQRRPKKKLASFASAIGNFTEFPQPIHMLVGENRPPSDIATEGGYVKLPNKEFYPKNVFDKMGAILRAQGETNRAYQLERFAASRDEYPAPELTGYPNATDPIQINDFLDWIQLSSFTIEPTEINLALRTAYEAIQDPVTKAEVRTSIPMLQVHLQNQNVSLLSQIPKTIQERVRFFQGLPPSLERSTFKFLQVALNGFMPEYTEHLIVGSSYDAVTGEVLFSSPFSSKYLSPSPMGYLLPSYLTCKRQPESSHTHVEFYGRYADYVAARLEHLRMEPKPNASMLDWKARPGHNLGSAEGALQVLSAALEVRVFHLRLNMDLELDDALVRELVRLPALDLSNRDSVSEWKLFFGKFGTHVVTAGHVGGLVQGSITVTSSREPEVFKPTLESLLRLENVGQNPSLQFFGGRRVEELADLASLNESKRAELFSEWKRSLPYEPVGLEYELALSPLSSFVIDFNKTLGEELGRACTLFISRELKYKRPKKVRTPSNRMELTTMDTIVKEQGIHASSTERLDSTTVPTQTYEESTTTDQTTPTTATSWGRPRKPSSHETNTQSIGTSTTLEPEIFQKKQRRRPNAQVKVPRQTTPVPSTLEEEKLILEGLRLTQANQQKAQDQFLTKQLHENEVREKDTLAEELKKNEMIRRAYEAQNRAAAERKEEAQRQLAEMHRYYEQQHQRFTQQAQWDYDQRKARMEEELREAAEQQERFLALLKIIIEKQRKEAEAAKSSCLREGTMIQMADGSTVPVEGIRSGDLILDTNLRPTRVLGVLKKFLLNDHFYGFRAQGPFFFTDTHLLVGADPESSGFYAVDAERLRSESPLMEYLDVNQFSSAQPSIVLAYDMDGKTLAAEEVHLFRDPVTHPPTTPVYVLAVESETGNYIADGYACHHEIPPLEPWPNTVQLLMGLASRPALQDILSSVEYNLENVEKMDSAVQLIADELDGVFGRSIKSYCKTSGSTGHFDPHSVISSEGVGALLNNSMISKLVFDIYGSSGKGLSTNLDNPESKVEEDELNCVKSTVNDIVTKIVMIIFG